MDSDQLLRALRDALIPGFVVEFAPDDAERAGAFEEEALSLDDLLECTSDLLEVTS